MNNIWKYLGGAGGALLALMQIISMILRTQSEWYEFDAADFILSILWVIGLGLISAAFFKANTTASPAAPVNTSTETTSSEVPSIGSWIGWMLLMCIPLVNLVFMIIWAIDNNNKTRKNWVIACLILSGISLLFSFLLGIFIAIM